MAARLPEERIPAPIFVVGKNRSGTKWVSNVIANHPDVACVQRDGGGGIVECTLLTSMPRVFGTLAVDENYIGFLECFSRTSFFQLTGLDKDGFYENRAADYLDFFGRMMDRYAKKEARRHWIQKTSTASVHSLYVRFPGAKFVVITRDIVDNIRSEVGLRLRRGEGKPNLLREVFRYFLEGKRLESLEGRPNVLSVEFEKLQRDKRSVVEDMCGFLGLPFEEQMLVDRFERNTSFSQGLDRGEALSSADEALIRSVTPLFRALPGSFYEGLFRAKAGLWDEALGRSDSRRFHRGAFCMVRKEVGWAEATEAPVSEA